MVYAPGDSFAGYTITRLIGRGGMGEVYLARHPTLPRDEAVKVLPSDLSRDPMFRRRFMREAELASSIVHPSIVTIYNSGEYEGHLWLAMEYIDGVDGGDLLRSSPRGLHPQLVSAIATSVASALDAAHTRGLLHRDVKPANILVQEASGTGAARTASGSPRVLLADFGIAKSTSEVSNLTSANMFLGTVAYVAPEQLLGSEINGQADQYSLAATLYQFLCGRPPFEGAGHTNVIAAHLNSAPPRVSSLRPGTPAVLDEVMSRALAKAPEERFSSCGEFAGELSRALRAAPTQIGTPIPETTDVIRPGSPQPGSAFPSTLPPQPPQSVPQQALPHPALPHPALPHPALPQQAFPQQSGPQFYPPPPVGVPPSGAFPAHPSQPGFPGGYPTPGPQRRPRGTAVVVLASLIALVLVVVAGVVVANLISDSGDSGSREAATAATTSAPSGSPATTPYTRPPVTLAPTAISSASQIAVGNCIQIAQQRDAQGNLPTSTVDCATPAMTFYAAVFVSGSSECPNEHNASLTFGDTPQKLCLTPNFVPSECYQIPNSGGSLADYHDVGCGSAPASGTVLVGVTNRSTSALACAAGELRWTFEQPESLGYCLKEGGP